MVSTVISISLPRELLEEIDESAAVEHRTRSELLSDAARRYLRSEQRWRQIQAEVSVRARAAGIETEDDVEELMDSLPD